MLKIYLDSVGCRLNQAEIEMYAQQFSTAGHILVSKPHEADLAVLNTCTVTAQAASDSRNKIRNLHRVGVEHIVLTGCWSSMQPQEASAYKGVCQVIPNLQKDGLVQLILEQFATDTHYQIECSSPKEEGYGRRHRTRAFIKVQDGCNEHCTFCVTTLARGRERSRLLEDILLDIQSALDRDVKEVVLSGVQLAAWGRDLFDSNMNKLHIGYLIEAILARSSPPRLRLSSLEPWYLAPPFFQLWQDKRLCQHIHLPLQSGCDRTLQRMARRTRQHSFSQLVEMARKQYPSIAITTDILVGFPGETEADFATSLDFVRQMSFAGGHVFTYSERPGTAAANMANQVPFAERKKRNAVMQAVLHETAVQYQKQFYGCTRDVLWERATAQLQTDKENGMRNTLTTQPNCWKMEGLTDNNLRVSINANKNLWNQITPVFLSEENIVT